MRARTPGAALPKREAPVSGWVLFGDAQTGQLDKSNDRFDASLEITDTCQRRYAELVKTVNHKPWWVLFK